MGIIVLALAEVTVGLLAWFIRTYWVALPAITGFVISLCSLLPKPRGNATSARELMERTIKNRVVTATFLALLLIYLVLYCLVPAHIMPAVNEAKKRELKELAKRIVGNASSDADKARRICEWVHACLINIYREYRLDNYVVLLNRPPFVCLRMLGEDYPLWPLASRCGACMEYSLLYMQLFRSSYWLYSY